MSAAWQDDRTQLARTRLLDCLVFADDPVAADATCCRLMSIQPNRVRRLQMTAPLDCQASTRQY